MEGSAASMTQRAEIAPIVLDISAAPAVLALWSPRQAREAHLAAIPRPNRYEPEPTRHAAAGNFKFGPDWTVTYHNWTV